MVVFLMFSKGENLYTTIQMGHFASEIIIKDDVVNSEDILTQIDEVMMFIRKHISKELIITEFSPTTYCFSIREFCPIL